MSHSRPSLHELRLKAQKRHHREIGNVLARRFSRPSAIFGTWLAVRLGLSAHQVTLLATLFWLTGAAAIGLGTATGFVLGIAFLHLAYWLDHVDGQVARWRGTTSLDGVYFDYLMHHFAGLTTGFALGFGLAIRTDQIAWTICGFSTAMGWSFLSLHNDCRYKSFFQRLKSAEGSFQVEGGSGGRPSPATPLPGSFHGIVTWLAYKSCEAHVVLMGLTVLAFTALVNPVLWDACWRWSLLTMSVLAPSLALLRIARSIRRGSTEVEFGRWFQPLTTLRADSSKVHFPHESSRAR